LLTIDCIAHVDWSIGSRETYISCIQRERDWDYPHPYPIQNTLLILPPDSPLLLLGNLTSQLPRFWLISSVSRLPTHNTLQRAGIPFPTPVLPSFPASEKKNTMIRSHGIHLLYCTVLQYMHSINELPSYPGALIQVLCVLSTCCSGGLFE
jgi:hypothetical protein